MKKTARKKTKPDTFVSPLCDRELALTISDMLKLLKTRKGRAELFWIVARVIGWRYDNKTDQAQKYWRWDRETFRTKIYAYNPPEYFDDRNEVAIAEDRFGKSGKFAIMYGNCVWEVLQCALKRPPRDYEMLRASAVHRCIGIVALHIKEYQASLKYTVRTKTEVRNMSAPTHEVYDFLYPSSR